jgi:hypothetical protein
MIKPRVLWLCAVVALAACHRQPSSAPQAKPAPQVRVPVPAQHGPTPAELTAGMVEAASQGKSQAPVALKFDLLQRPTVGQPLEIALAIEPQVSADSAIINVSGSDSLQLAVGERQIEIPSIEASQVYRHSIKVTPTADGVLLLNVTVGLKHDQIADSRAFTVPIIVAASTAGATSPTGAASTAGATSATGAASPTSAADQRK